MMATRDRSILHAGRMWVTMGILGGLAALLGTGGIAHAGEQAAAATATPAGAKVDSGDTAWVLVSAALVMLMTPGRAPASLALWLRPKAALRGWSKRNRSLKARGCCKIVSQIDRLGLTCSLLDLCT